ncbi:hypothetical protein EJ04DRAFT_529288 [Polyplosphaeria fusca]|uniref:Ubiquitin 3 binding protein But2 C-terminal domain-containing protein n=1 Tax=Polyplosphaeria fusca TaxID=682080 RepID=A0A9P4UTA4_9PLEO|nr:hypothetical protein EJ04DRAFT_529288 [Polyplosphaeria fusca]
MRSINLASVLLGLQAASARIINTQFPHLIVPVKEESPNQVFGTQYSGEISQEAGATSRVFTEILFDVPLNEATSCKVNFIVSEGAPREVTGSGAFAFDVWTVSGTPKDQDSWNNRPQLAQWVLQVKLNPDGSVKSKTGGSVPCVKGLPNSFVVTPGNGTEGWKFTWLEIDFPLQGIVFEMSA